MTFGVAFVVGEPSVSASIAIESADTQHAPPVVPRSLQSTAGLLTGTVVAGVTLGGLVGVLTALALGRFGRLGPRATPMAVAAAGFVALYVVPTLAYPPDPPAVGHADTIGYRTALYVILVAISTIAMVAAVLTGRWLAKRWGSWYAGLVAAAGYLVVTGAALALLPSYDEVPESFPATLLYEFRRASFLTQLTLWTVLGVVLAELIGRLTDGAQPVSGSRRSTRSAAVS